MLLSNKLFIIFERIHSLFNWKLLSQEVNLFWYHISEIKIRRRFQSKSSNKQLSLIDTFYDNRKNMFDKLSKMLSILILFSIFQ